MNKLRLSLAVDTEPRDSSHTDKDSLLQNLYVDEDPAKTTYIVQRPGFYVGTEAVTTGDNRGVFVNPNDGNNYYIDNTNTAQSFTFDFINPNWSAFAQYFAGDEVVFDDNGDTWTATQNSLGQPPYDGSDYWELSGSSGFWIQHSANLGTAGNPLFPTALYMQLGTNIYTYGSNGANNYIYGSVTSSFSDFSFLGFVNGPGVPVNAVPTINACSFGLTYNVIQILASNEYYSSDMVNWIYRGSYNDGDWVPTKKVNFASFLGSYWTYGAPQNEVGSDIIFTTTGNFNSWSPASSTGIPSGHTLYGITATNTKLIAHYADNVYNSSDGISWNLVSSNPFGSFTTVAYRIQLISDGINLYSLTSLNGTTAQILKSTDNGVSWSPLSSGPPANILIYLDGTILKALDNSKSPANGIIWEYVP